MAGNDGTEPGGYLSLDVAARRQNTPDGASSSEGGEARPPGAVWSPRNGGPASVPPIAGSESPVTQYVPAAVDEDAAEEQPPPPPQRVGFFERCFSCFRGGAGKADMGSGSDNRHPSPLPLYIPPAPHVGKPFIPPAEPCDVGKKTLVLDLDETLVHSSFKPVPNPDYIIPVEIDGKVTDVYVLKRPWVDRFLTEVSQKFEVIVFTASLSKYADPLLDLLDKTRAVRWRLFRESCYPYEGNYVKDLTCLGRDMKSTIIVDNSPHSYIFQPFNAVPIRNFIDDMNERARHSSLAADAPVPVARPAFRSLSDSPRPPPLPQDLLDLLPKLLQLADEEDVTVKIRQTYLSNVTPIYGRPPSNGPGTPKLGR